MGADLALDGSRILVVGGSSGVGRACAVAAASAGGRVAIAGRRLERLEAVAAESGFDLLALSCDTTDPGQCRSVVAAAAEGLGGLDVVIHTPADLRLVFMCEATADDWRVSWETNVVGPGLIAAAAVPFLLESSGRMIFVSSDVAYTPRSALGLYGITKHALDRLCVQFRLEVPDVRFATVTLGPTRPTEMGRVEDYPRFAALEPRWVMEGMVYRDESTVEDVGKIIVGLLTTTPRVDNITIEPPAGGPH